MIQQEDITKCTGCSACAVACPHQAIRMLKNKEGFYYPAVNSSVCVKCGVCIKTCPISEDNFKWRQTLDEKNLKEGWAAINNSLERSESASGGVFPMLAEQIIREGGVVFGAAWDKQWNVRHIYIESEDTIKLLQGAKYVQSNMGSVYKDAKRFLLDGRKVLFTGTPCQIAGLKKFLKCDYKNLYCIDMICHGVPSEKAWKSYLKWRMILDKSRRLPECINLRKKEPGWSKYQYSLQFVYKDGNHTSSPCGYDTFMRGFTTDLYLRESCYQCEFKGEKRAADITLGDFWGIWEIDSSMDDNKGTSAVIVHTEKGKELWNKSVIKMKAKQFTIESITEHNSSYYLSAQNTSRREKILRTINEYNFEVCINEALALEKVKVKRKVQNLAIIIKMVLRKYLYTR